MLTERFLKYNQCRTKNKEEMILQRTDWSNEPENRSVVFRKMDKQLKDLKPLLKGLPK